MPYSRQIFVSIAAAVFMAGVLFCNSDFLTASAQTRLTYPEINTALQSKLPNRSFKNKTELINWIIVQIRNRKIDKPLTKDREDDLRQAGATAELIEVIKANSPPLPTETPRETVVDLGDLMSRAVNLVKPEYTPEARRAGINGLVKLQLRLDEEGRVIYAKAVSFLPNGLTEQALAAAKTSTFAPASVNGKPAPSVGTITYNFKVNRIDVASTLALADGYRDKADCDRAIAEYKRVIDIDARHSRALLGRGLCYLAKTNYEDAITDLDSAARSNPSDGDSFFYLGVAYDFKGDPKAATISYDKAVRLNPEFDKRDLTDCLFIDRRRMTKEESRAAGEQIISACEASLRASPDSLASLIYVKRGIGYRLKSDYDKAISDFETARRLNPRFTAVQVHLHSAYNSRGLIHFNKKEYKEAFADISMAINLNPQSPTPYVNRCVIYLYAWKEFDQAISDCGTAIRLTDRSSMAYNHRGYAYEMKKNLRDAIADYKKALEIDPRNETARTNLSRLQQPSMKYP